MIITLTMALILSTGIIIRMTLILIMIIKSITGTTGVALMK